MSNVIEFPMLKKQNGFSILELVIVLSVLTLLTIQFIPLRDEYTETVAEQYTLRGFYEIANAAKAFYVESGNSVWPANMDALIAADLLPGYETDGTRRFNNGFGNAFQLSVQGNSVAITTVVSKSVNALAIAREWGPLASYDMADNTITVIALRPGYEVAHDSFFLHSGAKPMTGDIEMAKNSLLDAQGVYAQELNTNRVLATVEDGSGLVDTDTVTTTLISADHYEYKNE